jgi:hypothetical protein
VSTTEEEVIYTFGREKPGQAVSAAPAAVPATSQQFALIPEWVIDRCPDVDLWLYCRLALVAADGQVAMSVAELVSITGRSDRKIQKTLRALKDAGVLEIVERITPAGARLSNAYVLTTSAPEEVGQ